MRRRRRRRSPRRRWRWPNGRRRSRRSRLRRRPWGGRRAGVDRAVASFLPKSRRARRRLYVVAAAAPVVALAAGLAAYALGDAAVFFYSPAQAQAKHVPPGRTVRLGGLVQHGSVARGDGGLVTFAVTDMRATDRVEFRGDLPDLFREGQGVVAQGAFRPDGVFEAREVLAKHDERYMPKEVAAALKKSGEWRPDAEVAIAPLRDGAGAGLGSPAAAR
ncbi:MAG: cytochrome c maturation protein CcmE [Caulobacteraceae bacterium]|nr:cytochrome c maturation protein CcmE [Caulobacter sp.]